MANNADILGEEAAVRQIVENDFSATNGVFEDDSVLTIRQHAFRDKSLIKAVFPILTNIGNRAFYNNTRLEEVDFPQVTTIEGGAFYGAFASGIKAVFPEVTSLAGDSVFSNAKAKSIILPKLTYMVNNEFNSASVNIIDFGYVSTTSNNTFINNNNLIAIVLRKNSVVTTSVATFNNTKYATNGAGGAYVYVPRDLIATYQAATNWATLYAAHSDMFRALEDYTVDGTTTGEFDETKL